MRLHTRAAANYIQDREAVFPTRQSLGAMKTKLKGAETGHSLLKRKSEALTKYVFPRLPGAGTNSDQALSRYTTVRPI